MVDDDPGDISGAVVGVFDLLDGREGLVGVGNALGVAVRADS